MSALSVRYGTRADRGQSATAKTSETLLWENPSPTTARSSLDAELSNSLQNYSKIRIEYAYNTSSTSAPYYVVFPVKNASGAYMFPSGTQAQRMTIGLNNASGNPYARQFYVADDTTIHFNNAYRVNANASTNSNLIPWRIYGINGGYGGGSSGGGGSSIPVYTGPYDVTPKAYEAQTLSTAGKQMTEDVTVAKVPYYETSNTSGTTVYIAEETE